MNTIAPSTNTVDVTVLFNTLVEMGVPAEQARSLSESAVPAESRSYGICGKQMSLAEVAYITLVVKSENSEEANARRILGLPAEESAPLEEKMLSEAWAVLKSVQDVLGKKNFPLNAQGRQSLAGSLYTEDNSKVEAAKAAYLAAIEERNSARLAKLSVLGQ